MSNPIYTNVVFPLTCLQDLLTRKEAKYTTKL